MTTTDFVLQCNEGRNPALLALKWAKMKSGSFAFFRGTAPLFYRFWAKERLPKSPHVWICADAHIENVGSFRGANHIPYFDLNDFDEACLAPADWEIGRALTCLYLLKKPALARLLLTSYRDTLIAGKPSHIEPEVAVGPIARLLEGLKLRRPVEFMAERVDEGKLRIRPGHEYGLTAQERKKALSIYTAWAKAQPNGAALRALDVCGRIAGNGSLGLERYIVLVRGKHVPVLVDMKEAAPSAASRYLKVRQPRWKAEAERVATIQYFMQYVPIAGLSWTQGPEKSYIIRRLQPTEDRIDSSMLSPADYSDFIRQWAILIGSAQLRSCGWKGSVSLEALMAYGESLGAGAQAALHKAARRLGRMEKQAFAEFKPAALGK